MVSDGKHLEDGVSLSEWNVQKESTLQLTQRPVKTLIGNSVALDVGASDAVGDVKAKNGRCA